MPDRLHVAIPCVALVLVLAAAVARPSAGPQRRSGDAEVRLPVRMPGVHTDTLERSDGAAVHYAIAVPPNYSDTTRVPLVLALHYGAGDHPQNAGRDLIVILVGRALRDLGAIIVAPDSLGGGWDTPANEQAVLLLLDAVQSSYRIDAKKVVVTGFSMGGIGTWHYAAKYPDRFSAAIPVAGRPPAEIGAWRLPVFAVHSRDDTVVPIGSTGARIAELKRLGVDAQLVVLEGMTHFETSRHAAGLAQAVPWLKAVWTR